MTLRFEVTLADLMADPNMAGMARLVSQHWATGRKPLQPALVDPATFSSHQAQKYLGLCDAPSMSQ
jgi:hypothetical protein